MSSTISRRRNVRRTRIIVGRAAFVALVPVMLIALCREEYPERSVVAGQLAFAMALNAGALAFERHRLRWDRLCSVLDLMAGIGIGLAILAVVVWQNRGVGLM